MIYYKGFGLVLYRGIETSGFFKNRHSWWAAVPWHGRGVACWGPSKSHCMREIDARFQIKIKPIITFSVEGIDEYKRLLDETIKRMYEACGVPKELLMQPNPSNQRADK